MKLPIYFDNHSTTRMDDRVVESMIPYFKDYYGNPSSKEHIFGWTAEQAVENARQIIANSINAQQSEILFTSGTTESNNIALQCLSESFYPAKNHIITTNIEHSSVLNVLKSLQKNGIDVTFLPVNNFGLIQFEDVLNAITDKTFLVSVMMANNEIGTIFPIKEIGEICRERKILFHTDAAQAIGKIKFDIEDCNLDLVSFSAHKLFGPKGIGAIYIRKKIAYRLNPLFFGGEQENSIRPGTLNVPAIVGFGKAIEIAEDQFDSDSSRIKNLRDRLFEGIRSNIPDVKLNGHPDKRLYNNLNISFEGLNSNLLLMELRNIAFSFGSSCSSGSNDISHVLQAIRLDDELAKSTIRLGLGRFNTEEEIYYSIKYISEAINKIRTTNKTTQK